MLPTAVFWSAFIGVWALSPLRALAEGPPLTSETAGNEKAINPKTASVYSSVFSSWRAKPSARPCRADSPIYETSDEITADTACPFCIDDCPCPHGIIIDRCWNVTASVPGRQTTKTSYTPTPASPDIPRTATAPPYRTTIVRAPFRATDVAEPHPTATEPADDVQKPLHCTRDDAATTNEKGEDITRKFYTFPLSGFHPLLLPLITTNIKEQPVTLLAYTNFTFFNSYIFLPLVEELGLTKSIVIGSIDPPYIPERNVSSLLGFKTQAIGTLTLDILAGVNDRLVQDANFTVVLGPEPSERGGNGGWYAPDLVVGIDFLNGINALRLGLEYTGSRVAGARRGLGVVVQRVFDAGGEQPHGQDWWGHGDQTWSGAEL